MLLIYEPRIQTKIHNKHTTYFYCQRQATSIDNGNKIVAVETRNRNYLELHLVSVVMSNVDVMCCCFELSVLVKYGLPLELTFYTSATSNQVLGGNTGMF